jgi:hypothetical protein
MNSDDDKIYIKIVVFDEIYKFVVHFFSIWNHLKAQKYDILHRSRYRKLRSGWYIIFWGHETTLNEKSLNYKML